MTKTKTVTVKSKPSAIIREQIAALEWAEKQKGVKINMGTWCYMNGDRCELCEAGAWYAKTYGIEKAVNEFSTNRLEKEPTPIMHAMNYFRQGSVENAYGELGRTMPPILSGEFPITKYKDGKSRHKKDMLKLASLLEVLGE